jgi:pilus assembly protein CpaB
MLNENKWWRIWRIDAVLVMVAVLAGICGAVLSGQYLTARAAATEAGLRNRYESRQVVVAATDMAQGEQLDVARLAVRSMPKDFLPADAVPAERAAELIGGHMTIPIKRGSPVVPAAVSRGSGVRSLSATLAGERRALTIPVDQVNAQAGNLQPGDWVDLYYSRSNGGDAILMPLLQRVEILAAGSVLLGPPARQADPDQNFSTITLGLTATDAARVLLAQSSGSLSVVLRSRTDEGVVAPAVLHSSDLTRPSRPVRVSSSESRIELLVGGGGDLMPTRAWVPAGREQSTQPGDAS